jgi:uncharacterized protein (TIGR03437 family)
MRKGSLIALLLFAPAALAQAPQITSFTTGVPGDILYGPGTFLIIFGTFTTPSAGDDYTITVGGQTTGINVAFSGAFIHATIPSTTPPGATSLVITYLGQPSNALPITITPLAPEFQGESYSSTGGPQGSPIITYNPFVHQSTGQDITAASPASLGEVVQAEVTGLGSDIAPSVIPTVTIAGQNARVLQVNGSVNDPASETLYFGVPQSTPLGNDPVVVTVAGVASLTEYLVVGSPSQPAPVVPSNGIINNGGFNNSVGGGLVASPGLIVAIFGSNLSTITVPENGFVPGTNSLATLVQGTSVTFDGIPAPIYGVTPGQVNVQVPFELGTATSAQVVVTVNGSSSAPVNLPLMTATPGIVTLNSSGAGVAVIENADSTLNSAANPAARGDVIQIFATGLGPVSPLAVSGVAASSSPLSQCVNTPTVTIGGVAVVESLADSPFDFCGLTPNFVGLWQVNVRVPASISTGTVPLSLAIAGVTSNSVTVFVK